MCHGKCISAFTINHPCAYRLLAPLVLLRFHACILLSHFPLSKCFLYSLIEREKWRRGKRARKSEILLEAKLSSQIHLESSHFFFHVKIFPNTHTLSAFYYLFWLREKFFFLSFSPFTQMKQLFRCLYFGAKFRRVEKRFCAYENFKSMKITFWEYARVFQNKKEIFTMLCLG